MDSISNYLATHLQDSVRFNTIVNKITSVNDSVVVSTSADEIKADAVCITVPLGCLKENQIEFHPALPQFKRDTMERMGSGLLNKCGFEFMSLKFWEDKFSPTKIDMMGYIHSKVAMQGFCFQVWNLERVTGAKVLVGLISGRNAYEIENMADVMIEKIFTEILENIFGKSTMGGHPVKKTFISKWLDDQFSRGSYSYLKPGSLGREDYVRMSLPVHGRVFFAGEHCAWNHPATVPGAAASGRRTAGWIDEFLD